jgi:hypothetical protein
MYTYEHAHNTCIAVSFGFRRSHFDFWPGRRKTSQTWWYRRWRCYQGMYVCIYVCMYVCNICVHICVCAYIYICILIILQFEMLSRYIFVHIAVWDVIKVYICTYCSLRCYQGIYLYLCIMRTCVCMWIRRYIHTYIHACIHTRTHKHTHKHTYIHHISIFILGPSHTYMHVFSSHTCMHTPLT